MAGGVVKKAPAEKAKAEGLGDDIIPLEKPAAAKKGAKVGAVQVDPGYPVVSLSTPRLLSTLDTST